MGHKHRQGWQLFARLKELSDTHDVSVVSKHLDYTFHIKSHLNTFQYSFCSKVLPTDIN